MLQITKHLLICIGLVFTSSSHGQWSPYINKVTPEYPSRESTSQTGCVNIGLLIDWDGFLDSAWIQNSSGYPRLDQAALAAARKSTYRGPIQDSWRHKGIALIAKYAFLSEDADSCSEKNQQKSTIYQYFRSNVIPALKCNEVISDARRFSNTRPTKAFADMIHFRAVNEYLANEKKAITLLSPAAFNQTLIHCANNSNAMFVDTVSSKLDTPLSAPISNSKDELKLAIVGTWVPDMGNQDLPPGKGTYLADGTAVYTAYKSSSCDINYTAKGTWNVKGNELHIDIQESDHPDLFPVPASTVDEVLSITKTSKVLRDKTDGTIQFRIKRDICVN